MIAIIDYDAGNLKSVEKALVYLGKEALITRNPEELLAADHVILPGVGSFGDAMEKLHKYNLVDTIHKIVQQGTPFLGICLGLQLLFERSDESEGADGLGILSGEILRIPPNDDLKIPHMGWNSLELHPMAQDQEGNYIYGRLFQGVEDNSYVYFVHSYYLKANEEKIVTASTQYSTNIHASVEQDNVFACQFHPEKSGHTGLKILENFANIEKISNSKETAQKNASSEEEQ